METAAGAHDAREWPPERMDDYGNSLSADWHSMRDDWSIRLPSIDSADEDSDGNA